MEHKAAPICFHLVLSCAACCASHTVLRQVVFGLPRFLFPGGAHLKATLGMRSWSILRTCPSHWSHQCLISTTTLQQFVFLYRPSLEIFSGQKMQHIFQRHPLWNALIFFDVIFNNSPVGSWFFRPWF